MGIPNSQLETWSHLGAQESAKRTHESIRTSLKSLTWPGIPKEVYLQGSYKNHTNIYGNSDVDVVVELYASRLFDFLEYTHYKQSVMNAIANRGNKSVTSGTKSIKVANAPLNADVVVCQRVSDGSEDCIRFYSQDGRPIVNYPQQHLDNGAIKNALTGQEYKKTIRIFKNMREWLVDHYRIDKDLAPSYFIECLLYNAPNGCFTGGYRNIVDNILRWLKGISYTGWEYLKCQNDITLLIGESPEQWPRCKAYDFRAALIKMWDE